MSHFTMKLLKQMEAVSEVARILFLQKNQRFDGQQQVINILGSEDGMTQGNLAELLDIRPSSLAELLKKLEKAGAVERIEDENDKRIKRVFLTEKGRERIITNANIREDLSAQFFAGLTSEEQIELSNYLDKIMAGWPLEFAAYQTRTGDPMERLAEMQHLRNAMLDIDWQSLSQQEQRQMNHEFQKRFRHFGMDHRMWKRRFEQNVHDQDQLNRRGFGGRRPFDRSFPREDKPTDSDRD